MRLINFPVLSKKLGDRSRSSIHRDIKHRGFPPPLVVGRSALWDEEAVDNWLGCLAKVPYLPLPVAIPSPGKSRGRHKKSPMVKKTDAVQVEAGPVNTNSDDFKKRLRKFGVDPSDELIADEEVHIINASKGTYYILSLDSPVIGLYGSWAKGKKLIWPGKSHRISDEAVTKAFGLKLKTMQKKREKAQIANSHLTSQNTKIPN